MEHADVAKIGIEILNLMRYMLGAVVVAAFGVGGFFALTSWRLGRIERKLDILPSFTAAKLEELDLDVEQLKLWRASHALECRNKRDP